MSYKKHITELRNCSILFGTGNPIRQSLHLDDASFCGLYEGQVVNVLINL